MSFVKWKVERFAFNGISWSGTGTVIADIYDPIISVAIGDKKDSFGMKLNNPYGRWNNYFQPNDKLQISRVTNINTFDADDILMVGAIRDIPTNTTGTQDEIRLEGFNFSEAIVTGIVFYDTGDVLKSPLEIVKAALESLQLQNTNFTVTWSDDNPLLTKKDGSTSFPTYKKKYFYKPLSKVLEEMLSDPYTADGAYHWWVDKDNKLQIRADTAGTSYSFDPSTDNSVVGYKDGRDVSAVKNFIIIKGGTAPNGLPIQTRVQDYTSIAKHGFKFYMYVDETKYAENINQDDMVKSWGSAQSTKRFPTSYPFTTSWYALYTATVETVSVVQGNQVTVDNDAEYSAVLKEQAVTVLKSRGQDYINNTKWGKLKVDVTVNSGAKSWRLGDRIICTIARTGVLNKVLRLSEIQYTTETDTFSLEEDIGTV